MIYHTYQPHDELSSLVKFYWTLEVPFDPENEKQKIIPDGCIEMTFNLKDDIKRYINEDEFIIHPPCMIMGQRSKSYFIEPVGDVQSFAICFYPYGFANFILDPLENLVDKEVPIDQLFGTSLSTKLQRDIFMANSTDHRIKIIESFLFEQLRETTTIDQLVQKTVNSLLSTNGRKSINHLTHNSTSLRRRLERNFKSQIGLSPKRLGKIIRLQAALKLMLNENKSLTDIAYDADYFDQAHFIKDFKEIIGATPKEFFNNNQMALASLFYK